MDLASSGNLKKLAILVLRNILKLKVGASLIFGLHSKSNPVVGVMGRLASPAFSQSVET